MAKNKELFFTNARRVQNTKFTSADAANTWKDLLVPASEGTKWEVGIASSSSASQKIIEFRMNNLNNSVQLGLGQANVPAGAGTNGSVKIVSALNRGDMPHLQIDSDGNPFADYNFNMVIQVKVTTVLGAGEEISVGASGGDYDA